MSEELSTVYEPRTIEERAKDVWLSGGYFHPDASDGGTEKAYTIVIPPPNVTAALHLGHALNNTLQDVMIRFRRMQGFKTLWMPGTDHAGIATQTVVDKRLRAEGKPALVDYKQMQERGENGREQFIEKVQSWKDQYEARIIHQLQAMGCSCDWERVRFTMDEVCAKAVRTNFFNLFKDGLIYRGKRLVNWDPATQTVLADDEVEHETVQGHFWYLKYPLVTPVTIDGKKIEHITVATTRPETMLGDTAVAMNPSDPRAAQLKDKEVRLPIVGRIIPIITDEHVVLPDPNSEDEKAKFSTGFLKVTPAHDPDDWQIGLRHDLPVINVMGPDGSISDKHGWEDVSEPEAQNLLGMDRFEAREAIVEWFRQEKLLEDVRDYVHEVGHSYRSHVPIEPYLSDQWYIAVKKPIEHLRLTIVDCRFETEERDGVAYIKGTDVPVNSLAGLALSPLLDGRLRFIPERYAKTYQTWLENLRDWPISRQLWWGHRIPVWRMELSTNCPELSLSDCTNTSPILEKSLKKLLDSLGHDDIDFVAQNSETEHSVGYVCFKNQNGDDVLDKVGRFLSPTLNNLEPHKAGQPYPRVEQVEGLTGVPGRLESCNEFQKYIRKWNRDDDVLDTWFSSALWPFSTMGWPEETAELKTFYPGDVLCTAREIITLWVSRMVMMGQYCRGDIPFKDVYIHAMIQDGQGRKMSKSLGNGIDPLVAIDSHGADAMRFTLASMTTDTQDIRMPVESMTLPDGRQVNTSPKFDVGRNFCNKLWNASRFAMMNLEGIDPSKFDKSKLMLEDRWILSRLAGTIAEVTDALEGFKFSEPLSILYRFFWNDFCDWYLEWAKFRIRDEQQKPITQNVLAFVLDSVLRMLHPFVPFITEGIFQKLNEVAPVRSLEGLADAPGREAVVVSLWPARIDALRDSDAENRIELLQGVIRTIRDIRNSRNISPKERLTVSAKAQSDIAETLNGNAELIGQLAGVSEFKAGVAMEKPANAAVGIADTTEVYIHDAIDIEAERERLLKQKLQIEKGKTGVEAKLANENFVSRAKPEVVAQAKEKLAELTEQLSAIEKHLSELAD